MPSSSFVESQASVPSARPLLATGCWRHIPAGPHPRILGPVEHLRGLAAAKPFVFREIRDGRGRHTHWDVMSDAIVQAVEGLDPARVAAHIATAMENVARGPTNVHQDSWIWLRQVAFTFDYYHERLSADQRRQMIQWMNAHLDSFTDDENAFHNSTLSKILTYLQIAYATWGHNDRAQDFRDHAIVRLYEGRVLPVLLKFGQGGGFTECGWYCRGSVLHLVQAMELARRMEGYDGFAKAPAFYHNRMAYEMLQPYPRLIPGRDGCCPRYSCEGDGHKLYSQAMEYPRLMWTILAQYFGGSTLAGHMAARARQGSSTYIRMYEFLIGDVPDQPRQADGFPLSHLAAGIGKLFARSHWSVDATWLRFECGPYWNQHQHFEAGNFEIFRHEPLASDSGEYTDWDSPHAINWLVRTIAHNCILIHDPSEKWEYCRNRESAPMANDGGQASKTRIVHTLEDWLAKGDEFARGHVAAYRNQPEFMLVTGDATAAYGPKARRVERTILFIRPHAFVIVDRVVSAQAGFRKTWVMHCHNEPAVSGADFSVTHGKGSLHARTLLPRQVKIDKVHGYAYGGQSFEPADRKLSEAADMWRVEVTPATASCEDTFVHVLSTDGPIDAALTEAAGSLTVSSPAWEATFKDDGTGSLTIAGKTHRFDRTVALGQYET